ncbi:bis(5'-nucleosyl)-tetraphosphatase (symmetrical) YqeK [Halanaerobium praevalens]|uniref:bis(5'-nucleosyl)-tetraphosphatase (symmetrical) n=1 Tax=Halanaerobium praevalens (strain ATCC 33744 / DSM 2228 / GSL) TaxID=572479 RepID=E3DMY7_HALPG|nr:bis(5'-nucleosyl)-tetraphosphatase (symmetrical) YqeK [Halanaerobium praevalens]ADO77476.1 metal dependent phosphohydrolase [Halanaerobium praevalens DSM 2228]
MKLEQEELKTELDLEKIKEKLGEKRYLHSLSVLNSALNLAHRFNLNLEKVKKAALLHDIAKNKEKDELLTIIKNSNWILDDLELSIIPVLHAPAGAVIAQKEFNIDDDEILEAIRYHTLGHPKMGNLAKIIYAADFIAEDRSFAGLDEIRSKIEKNFEFGLYLITSHIIKYQLNQNNFIHPYSNDLRNKLLKRSD